jgi:hypothetical protein
MLYFRMSRPSGVTRGSCLILKTGPVCSFSFASLAFSSSALATIERNLSMLNCSPCSPTRTCRKNTGPFELSLTRAAIAKRNGKSTQRSAAEPAMSTTLFRIQYRPWAPTA